MDEGVFVIAPRHILSDFLAIFHRAFTAIDEYGTAEDQLGIHFGGWLADALHNVPGMLRDCRPIHEWHSPDALKDWLALGFLESLLEFNAPERILREAKCITSFERFDDESEFAISNPHFCIAPKCEFEWYTDKLADACIRIRTIRYHWDTPTGLLWGELEPSRAEEAIRQGIYNALIARLLLPVPKLLLTWSEAQENAFQGLAIEVLRAMPKQFQDPFWRNWIIREKNPEQPSQ
jgi:hypothetical protein